MKGGCSKHTSFISIHSIDALSDKLQCEQPRNRKKNHKFKCVSKLLTGSAVEKNGLPVPPGQQSVGEHFVLDAESVNLWFTTSLLELEAHFPNVPPNE